MCSICVAEFQRDTIHGDFLPSRMDDVLYRDLCGVYHFCFQPREITRTRGKGQARYHATPVRATTPHLTTLSLGPRRSERSAWFGLGWPRPACARDLPLILPFPLALIINISCPIPKMSWWRGDMHTLDGTRRRPSIHLSVVAATVRIHRFVGTIPNTCREGIAMVVVALPRQQRHSKGSPSRMTTPVPTMAVGASTTARAAT